MTTTESDTSPRSIVTGEPVRGVGVTMTISGLRQFRTHLVQLTLWTNGPVHTFSGDRMGYALLTSAIVDESGATTVAFNVPSSLSGEDDIIPLSPSQDYLLAITTQDDNQGVQVKLPFSVTAAKLGTAYPVRVARSGGECGAPALWVDFDGDQWLPDGPRVPEGKSNLLTDMFTLLPEGVASLASPDGTTTKFVRATTGWAC